MLTAFALVPSGAHLAALPNKMAMAQATAQQIDARWAFVGMMFRATKAGALYAILVFLIGFILGTIRVLLVAPHVGETIAVIIEAPIILAASWLLCGWCVDRLDVTATVPTRSLMGLVAFLVLMLAEVGLGAVLGRSLADQLTNYGSPAGAIGLAAQVIFATFPVIQIRWR
jgi:hypothetical protein